MEQRISTTADICDQVRSLGFDGYVVALRDSLRDSEPQIHPLEKGAEFLKEEEEDAALVNLFNAVSNFTSKEELLHKLREKLFLSVARNLRCCKIFTADGADDLAIKILSNIALGRGAHLPLDVGFLDSRDPEIKLLRPMRDFTRKELSYYLNFHKLETIQTPGLTTKKDPYVSIQKLTEKFVTELNTEFSGTVSAVFRTGEKLSTSNQQSNNLSETCALCGAPLDTVFTDTSSLQATEFSRLVSAEGPQGFIGKDAFELRMFPSAENSATSKSGSGNCDNCNCGKSKENASELSTTDLLAHLCYGCRLIFRDIDKTHQVPEFLQNAAKQRVSLDHMREEIADFLL